MSDIEASSKSVVQTSHEACPKVYLSIMSEVDIITALWMFFTRLCELCLANDISTKKRESRVDVKTPEHRFHALIHTANCSRP